MVDKREAILRIPRVLSKLIPVFFTVPALAVVLPTTYSQQRFFGNSILRTKRAIFFIIVMMETLTAACLCGQYTIL